MMSRMRHRDPRERQRSRDRSELGYGSNGVRVRFDERDWVVFRRGEEDVGEIAWLVRRVARADEGGDVQELVVAAGIGGGRDGVGGENVDLQWAQREVSLSGQS